MLTNDLQVEADRYQPRLSSDASLRIQQQVYRRMQRSMVWQRAGEIVRMGTAVAALVLLLMGSFVFGRFWIDSLSNLPEEATPGDTIIEQELPVPGPTAVPTLPPAIPNEQSVELSDPSPRNGRVNTWDSWVSVAPGQHPEQLAATIMTTALAQEKTHLNNLFIAMGAAQSPTAGMWLRLGNRCQQGLLASDFEFTRRPIVLSNIASVSILYNNYHVGEIKMRQVQGQWFATFSRVPTANPCPLR